MIAIKAAIWWPFFYPEDSDKRYHIDLLYTSLITLTVNYPEINLEKIQQSTLKT